jgi:hypothetical protein
MNLKELKAAVTGPMWSLNEIRVENINVISKWADDTTNGGGSVSLTDVPVSADLILDVFISFNGPNRAVFKMEITGSTDETPVRKLDFSQNYTITKNGWLAVTLSELIDKLVS